MMTPAASPGGYSGGSMASCGYPQSKVSQEPAYDKKKKKPKKKKKNE